MKVILLQVVVACLLFSLQVVYRLYQLMQGAASNQIFYEQLARNLGVSAYWSCFRIWTPFTYTFLHLNLFDLFYNLLFIRLLGYIIVYFLGSKHFLRIYLLGTLAGALVFLLFHNLMLAPPPAYNTYLTGAYVPVCALAAALATFAPYYEIPLFPFFSVRTTYFLLFFMLNPILKVLYGAKKEAVEGFTHLSAAFVGYLYIHYLRQREEGNWNRWVKAQFGSLREVDFYLQRPKKDFRAAGGLKPKS